MAGFSEYKKAPPTGCLVVFMDGFSVFDQAQHAGVDLVGQRQRAGEQRLALGGTLIEKLHMEDQVADFIRNANSSVSLRRSLPYPLRV